MAHASVSSTTIPARCAALALIAACAASPKQQESLAQPAPPTQPAAAAAEPSPRDAVAPDPWGTKPSDPAAELALLRADLDIFCGAAKVTGGKTVVDVGPYAAEHMKTAFKVELFADIRTVTLDEIVERIRRGMARANVQQCDTLDVLIANDPRKSS